MLAWGSVVGVHLRETKSHRQTAKWQSPGSSYTQFFKEWADLVVGEKCKKEKLNKKVEKFMKEHSNLYYVIPNDEKAKEIKEKVNDVKAAVDKEVPPFCGKKKEGEICTRTAECQSGLLCRVKTRALKTLRLLVKRMPKRTWTCRPCPTAKLCAILNRCINDNPKNVKNSGHENSLALFLDNAANSVKSLANKILPMLDGDCAIANEAYLTKTFASSTAKLAEKMFEKGWQPIKIVSRKSSSGALTRALSVEKGAPEINWIRITKKKLTKEEKEELLTKSDFKSVAEKFPGLIRIDEGELRRYVRDRTAFFNYDFKDGLRCSIVCKTLDKLSKVVYRINDAEHALVPSGQQIYWKNTFNKRSWEKGAYADVKAFVPMLASDEKTTTVAEIQFHFVTVYDAGPLCPKEHSHLMYKHLDGDAEKDQVTRAQDAIFLFGWCLVEDLGTKKLCCPTCDGKNQKACWDTILEAREVVFKNKSVKDLMKKANNGKDVTVKKESKAKGDHADVTERHGQRFMDVTFGV